MRNNWRRPLAYCSVNLFLVLVCGQRVWQRFLRLGGGIDSIGISPNDYTPQAYQQTGDCRGFTTEGVEIGTYSFANLKPVTVLDEGSRGETSFGGAARIEQAVVRTPAAQGYLVLYGVTDANAGVTKLAFKANLQQMITAVRNAGKAIFLAKAPPDFHTYFSDPSNGPDPSTVNDLMAADNQHPNGEGYRSMAALWCRELRGQLGMPFDMTCP